MNEQRGWRNTLIFLGIAAIFGYFLTNNDDSSKKHNRPENGDLDTTFVAEKNGESENTRLTIEEKLTQKKDSLIAEGWEDASIENGILPACYNFSSKKSKINNYLEVTVGGGTDVAIKVMNLKTHKCIRYVFINRLSTYKIKNLPEGKYYLKIAYGKDWFSKVEKNQCIGKFIRSPIYEKGEDIMDFNLQHTSDGYSIPSYYLKLDVIESEIMNTFDSEGISETEFNL